VRRYLAEFLSDPRVVALPRPLWLPILHGIVLRTRPAKSAEKYRAIWTPEGSPLAVHTARQAKLCGADYAMRYGEPSIRSKLKEFRPSVVIPLFPQYSDSATGSVMDLVPKEIPLIRDFHDHPAYIEALAANLRRHWERHGKAHLVMSFHGLPKRAAGTYEQQCRTTAHLLAGKLHLPESEWTTTFQSRFGWAEWLQPYTEPTLVGLARNGRERVDVVCPGFVSDCLETLEELGIAARRAYLRAGGREFHLVPCLNESPEWISALAVIARGAGNGRDRNSAKASAGTGSPNR
jgi:ferrochelatase